MREIKLRSYAQNSEVMVYQEDFNKWINGFIMHVEFKPWEDDETEFVAEYIWIENEGAIHTIDNPPVYSSDDMVKVMQYTGLTDKNGTEIYEGDVLQAFDREDFRMQIVYREPSFCIKWFDETIKSVRQTRDGTEPIPHNIHVTSRVIGNIYEHPHLLKE